MTAFQAVAALLPDLVAPWSAPSMAARVEVSDRTMRRVARQLLEAGLVELAGWEGARPLYRSTVTRARRAA